MLSFLEVEDGFINLAKNNNAQVIEHSTLLPNSVALKLVDVGVLEIKPAKKTNIDIVMSCGIHGNETAPIEIISKLISQIVKGVIEPKVNLLFILGNPESMKIPARFLSINMNRLFAGAYKKIEMTNENQYELERAQKLEEYVTHFYNVKTNKRLHLDLHTAIKASYHKTFAIRPFSSTRINQESKSLLSAMGIEAVMQHNKASTTFSYFSAANFNAEAYTLELGKVETFGNNKIEDFTKAANCLAKLIKNQPLEYYSDQNVIEYKVVAEIIRQSEDFKFYVDNKVANFTPYPQGSLIAEDSNYSYRVAYKSEAVVFPNIDVPVGQRVAVMVTNED